MSRVGGFGPEVRTAGVVLRKRLPETPVIGRLVSFAAERDIALSFEPDEERAPESDGLLGTSILRLGSGPSPDLIVSLGGDGTMLRAARRAMDLGVPVLGVNLGRLGFLTSASEAEMEEGLGMVLAGKARLDRRFTLTAEIDDDGGELVEALNDIVVHTVGAARVAAFELAMADEGDDQLIGDFTADGVIVTTPTGSTAYSLSAGGPIISPGVECLVVTAICPHSLTVRPLVIPADAALRIRTPDAGEELNLTADGRFSGKLSANREVRIRRGKRSCELVRLPGHTFFRTMRRKLNWAARPPERG